MRARMKKNQSGNFALALFLALILYPEPDSNRHASEDIGVWDQRVYQFRHRGILIGGQSYVKFCLIQNIKTIKAPKITLYP